MEQRTDAAVRIRFGARGGAVVIQIHECATVGASSPWQVSRDGGPDASSRLCETRLAVPVAQATRDAAHAGIYREHWVSGCKEQHPVSATLTHLRQAFQGFEGRQPANHRWQGGGSAEDVHTGFEGLTLLQIRSASATLSSSFRATRHRVRRQRARPLQCAQRGVTFVRRRVNRQHFPHEQREGIAGGTGGGRRSS